MFDDPGDLDHNGIPDAIQADPVVVPGEPAPFSMYGTADALPGINAPIEGSLEPMPETPVEPTPPPADADEATIAAYQQAMQRYARQMDMLSKILQQMHDMQKDIIGNTRA